MQKSQLEYFIAVADNRNFTKAAEYCHLTQSAISQQISALESEIGFRLFERDTRKVVLTAAGETYYLTARRAIETLGRGADAGREIASGKRGRLVFGIVSANQAANLTVLGDFLDLYPDIDVEFTHITTTTRYERVASGEVDVVFTLFDDAQDIPGISFVGGFDDPMALFVSSRHPFAGRSGVTCRDLVDQTILIAYPGREEADRTVAALAREFTGKGLKNPSILRLDDQDSLWMYMEMGRGVLLIPSSLEPSRTQDVDFVPLDDFHLTNHLGWAFQQEPINPVARLLRDYLTDQMS